MKKYTGKFGFALGTAASEGSPSPTEQYVNLVALNQFELFGAAEAFGFAALLIAAGFTGPTGLLMLSIGTLALENSGTAKHSCWSRRKFAAASRIAAGLTCDHALPACGDGWGDGLPIRW